VTEYCTYNRKYLIEPSFGEMLRQQHPSRDRILDC